MPLVVALLVATPLPTTAGSTPNPTADPPRPSLTVLAQQAAADMPRATIKAQAARTSAQPQAPPAAESNRGTWSFFKSPAGIAIIATLGVGVGYAIYSTQNDRVSSPGK